MMNKILCGLLILLCSDPVFGAQQTISQITAPTATREALRNAVNTENVKTQSNFVELYAATPNDLAYGAAWNANLRAPSMNAIYDKIEALILGSANLPAGTEGQILIYGPGGVPAAGAAPSGLPECTVEGQILIYNASGVAECATIPAVTAAEIAALSPTVTTATDYTIGTGSVNECYGGTIFVTGAATITGCTVAPNMEFTVVTVGDVAVSMDPNAADRVILDGTALADGDKVTNQSTSGDTLYCKADSVAGYFCWSGSMHAIEKHWADGN